MGFENDKKETPSPYDPYGKGFVGEGVGAPVPPLKDEEQEDKKENK